MKEITVNKKFFNNYTYDNIPSGESSRFYNDENYIKIIHPGLLKDDREKIVRELYYFNHPNIVTPKFILKDKSGFIGYGMDFLKDYKSLALHLELDNLSFDERKELMIRLSKIFDYFDEKKFAYFDIHSNNILYKDGDIKIIDLDSGVINPYINDRVDFDLGIRASKKALVRYTLSTIYDITNYELLSLNSLKDRKYYQDLMNNLPKNVRNLYEFAFADRLYIIYGITDALEEITQGMNDDINEIVEKKLRLY